MQVSGTCIEICVVWFPGPPPRASHRSGASMSSPLRFAGARRDRPRNAVPNRLPMSPKFPSVSKLKPPSPPVWGATKVVTRRLLALHLLDLVCVLPLVAVLVVLASLVLVRQDLVRVVDLFELGFGGLIAGLYVGMELLASPSIGRPGSPCWKRHASHPGLHTGPWSPSLAPPIATGIATHCFFVQRC